MRVGPSGNERLVYETAGRVTALRHPGSHIRRYDIPRPVRRVVRVKCEDVEVALNRVKYLRWAKALPERRYALAASGVPAAGVEMFDPAAVDLVLDVHDAYGLEELITAIRVRYGVSPDHILPLPGASMANFIALGCVLRRGAHVLVEHPVYEPLLRVADFLDLESTPLRRDPQRRYRFDLDFLESALARGADAVVMSDLHNPTGLRCPRKDLRAVADLTAANGAYLIVDEVYRDYACINGALPPGTAATLGDHVIVTNSLTKVYGLGTLRAGWMLAEPEIIERARDLLDHLCVINPAPSQQLAAAALAQQDRLAERTRRIHQAGYPVFSQWLDSRDDVVGWGNDGAVFEFPRIAGLDDTRSLCQMLAQEYDVSVVPGAFFGAPQHVRISFTPAPDLLAEGLARISKALDRL